VGGTVKKTRKTRLELYQETLPKGGIGVEVGVQNGDNAALLMEATQPQTMALVDPWKEWDAWPDVSQEEHYKSYRRVADRFQEEIRAGQVLIIRSVLDDVFEAFCTMRPSTGMMVPSLDWIYIDGDHRYDAALEDLRAANVIVKPDGVIAGHDYVSQDRSRWAKKRNYGVIEAVAQFERESDWRLVEVASSPEKDIFPSFIMRNVGGG